MESHKGIVLNLKHYADLISKIAEYGAQVYMQAMHSDDPKMHRHAEETLIELEIGLQNVQRAIEREIGGSTGDPEGELSLLQRAIGTHQQSQNRRDVSSRSLGYRKA